MVVAAEHTLYIVATPIGNRDDVTLRAIETLKRCKRIYAEDTRHSKPLLQHHGISVPLMPLHEHNETIAAEAVADFIESTGSAALISDAGTPLISDPGYRLVRVCQARGIRVSPVPGASALTAAICAAGLPTDRFIFAGFPPAKTNARQKWLATLEASGYTVVLYESPHRITATLQDIQQSFGAGREMTMARELTKRFETIVRASVSDVSELLQRDSQQQRGEFVLILSGKTDEVSAASEMQLNQEKLMSTLLTYLPLKSAAKCASEITGQPRKDLYNFGLLLQKKHKLD